MSNSTNIKKSNVVKINFATLKSSAPVAKRGGGKSADPSHCHFGVGTRTLKLPLDFLSKYGFKSGFVTLVGDILYVIMSPEPRSVNGSPFSSFHQDPKTRHLVIPSGEVATYLGKIRDFTASASDATIEGLPKGCETFILKPQN